MAYGEDWDGIARSIGFIDEKQMLTKFYTDWGMSISDISKRLGSGTTTIVRRLSICHITKRGKGGPNNSANQRRKLFHLDQRFVMFASLEKVAGMVRCSKSCVYKYRRSVTGGFDGVLHNRTGIGPDEVRDPFETAFGAAAGDE